MMYWSPATQRSQGKFEKNFDSGKTWTTQKIICALPDLRENLGKIFVWSGFYVYAIQLNTYSSKDGFDLSLSSKDTLLSPQYF